MKLSVYKKEELQENNYLFEPTELCEIMGRNKSDKGNIVLTRCHNYTTLYSKLFSSMRHEHINIFELGIGTNFTDVRSNMGVNGRPGASLYGWSEYFPNALVYGADIDSRVLFETGRIKTFECDQSNPIKVKDMWNNETLKNLEFDIIIEDGWHAYTAQICFFENSIHKLKPGGYYVIEDVKHGSKLEGMCEYFSQRVDQPEYDNLDVEVYELPASSAHHRANGNNGLVIIHKTF